MRRYDLSATKHRRPKNPTGRTLLAGVLVMAAIPAALWMYSQPAALTLLLGVAVGATLAKHG